MWQHCQYDSWHDIYDIFCELIARTDVMFKYFLHFWVFFKEFNPFLSNKIETSLKMWSLFWFEGRLSFSKQFFIFPIAAMTFQLATCYLCMLLTCDTWMGISTQWKCMLSACLENWNADGMTWPNYVILSGPVRMCVSRFLSLLCISFFAFIAEIITWSVFVRSKCLCGMEKSSIE